MLLDDYGVTELELTLGPSVEESKMELDETWFEELDSKTELELIEVDESMSDELSVLISSVKGVGRSGFQSNLQKGLMPLTIEDVSPRAFGSFPPP